MRPTPLALTDPRLRILAPLGRGGMSDVWLAATRGPAGFEKLVAVKQLRLVDEVDRGAAFLHEARLSALLNHPNIVQTFEIVAQGGDYRIVMEFLEGQPLNRVLSRAEGTIPLPDLARVLIDVLAGLHYAHEITDRTGRPMQVVHRDVSPHNVFVTWEGGVKLLDFGVAVFERVERTDEGLIKGKLTYMSPEQAKGTGVDRRADVFSVGVVLWELLSGKRMWAGLTDRQLYQELVNGRIPPIDAAAPGAPEELRRICARALAPSRDDRYATADEMRTALDAWLGLVGRPSPRALGERVVALFGTERERIRALVTTGLAVQQDDEQPTDLYAPTAGPPLERRTSEPPPARTATPASASRGGAGGGTPSAGGRPGPGSSDPDRSSASGLRDPARSQASGPRGSRGEAGSSAAGRSASAPAGGPAAHPAADPLEAPAHGAISVSDSGGDPVSDSGGDPVSDSGVSDSGGRAVSDSGDPIGDLDRSSTSRSADLDRSSTSRSADLDRPALDGLDGAPIEGTMVTERSPVEGPRPSIRAARWLVPLSGAVGVVALGLLVGWISVAAMALFTWMPAGAGRSAVVGAEGAPGQGGAAALGPGGCPTGWRPVVDLGGDIDADATLSCGSDYRLVGVVRVLPGATLTVAPGTVVRGDPATRGTLVVSPGGRLVADGTREAPILFTTAAERPAPGDWGGIVVLGRAPTNTPEPRIEGLASGDRYGGDDPDDDSGVLRYVRIGYAGVALGPNNETNGLTLAGVGRGTVLDSVQVFSAGDDCFEFFGGTVDGSRLVCLDPGDDGFDLEQGYTGHLSQLVAVDRRGGEGERNGIEADTDPTAAGAPGPRPTAPTVQHVTLCGSGAAAARPGYGLLVRRGAVGTYTDLLVDGFSAALEVRDEGGLTVRGLAVAPGVPLEPVGEEDDDGGLSEAALVQNPWTGAPCGWPPLGGPGLTPEDRWDQGWISWD